MQAFKCEGVWWTPDRPNDVIVGTLRCKADGGSTLSLVGSLGDPLHTLDKTHPVILGITDSSPIGRLITLTRCRLFRQSISMPGLQRESYHAGVLYAGRHLTKDEDYRFSGCSLSLSGLGVWTWELRGLSTKWNSEQSTPSSTLVTVQYTRPPTVEASVKGATVSIRFILSGSQSLREHSIREKVAFNLGFQNPQNLESINQDFAYPLQNLLTLACDFPNAITEWSVEPGLTSQDNIQVRMERVYSDASAEKRSPPDLLFSLQDIGSRFQSMIDRWLTFSSNYSDVCNLYFGIQYRSSLYTDLRFQTVNQALALYASRRTSGQELPVVSLISDIWAALNVDQRRRLDSLLRGNPVLQVEAALKSLLEAHWQAFKPLVVTTPDRFINRTLSTLHYIQQRNPSDYLTASRGADLYYHTQQLAWLIKLCLLDELGFTSDERTMLVERNPDAQHLRTQICRLESAKTNTPGPTTPN